MTGLLKLKVMNRWGLFWLLTAAISSVMIVAMSRADLSNASAVSSLIQLSVRCAVPLVFVVFAASAVQTLVPGPFGGWLLRNRKYLGLAFAAAMAWQGFFILWMVSVYTSYYVEQVYVLRDAIEGATGYFLLFLMTITTFQPARRMLSATQWRALHLVGIYFLWAYAFGVYWWALFYYGNPVPLDYLYYMAGILAWLARAAAWHKRTRLAAERTGMIAEPRPVLRFAGFAVVGVGAAAAVFGASWSPTAARLLYGYSLTEIPETYLPYWPFEPFLPLLVMAFGTWLIARSWQDEAGRREPVAA
jgi:hypothetical protein